MVMKIVISWTYLNDGLAVGGNREVDNWDDIRPYLVKLEKQAGALDVDLVDPADPGPIGMQLASENGIYLVTLLQSTKDDTYVRSYNNTSAQAEMVEVLGNRWDARQLTNDFSMVAKFFEQFCKKGDVSSDWLA
jgi:hypothetical protein